jgi:hypothetical protein
MVGLMQGSGAGYGSDHFVVQQDPHCVTLHLLQFCGAAEAFKSQRPQR